MYGGQTHVLYHGRSAFLIHSHRRPLVFFFLLTRLLSVDILILDHLFLLLLLLLLVWATVIRSAATLFAAAAAATATVSVVLQYRCLLAAWDFQVVCWGSASREQVDAGNDWLTCTTKAVIMVIEVFTLDLCKCAFQSYFNEWALECNWQSGNTFTLLWNY